MAVNMVFPSVPVIVAVPALMAAVPGAFAPVHFTLVGLVTISFSLGGQVRPNDPYTCLNHTCNVIQPTVNATVKQVRTHL